MDIFWKLLAAVLVAVVPVLTGFLCDLIHKAADSAKIKTENEHISALIGQIDRAVMRAVSYVNQTFVDELKASGVFKEDENYAKEALEMAFQTTVETISDEAAEYIFDTFGDIRKYLEVRIEEAVFDQKRW